MCISARRILESSLINPQNMNVSLLINHTLFLVLRFSQNILQDTDLKNKYEEYIVQC